MLERHDLVLDRTPQFLSDFLNKVDVDPGDGPVRCAARAGAGTDVVAVRRGGRYTGDDQRFVLVVRACRKKNGAEGQEREKSEQFVHMTITS